MYVVVGYRQNDSHFPHYPTVFAFGLYDDVESATARVEALCGPDRIVIGKATYGSRLVLWLTELERGDLRFARLF